MESAAGELVSPSVIRSRALERRTGRSPGSRLERSLRADRLPMISHGGSWPAQPPTVAGAAPALPRLDGQAHRLPVSSAEPRPIRRTPDCVTRASSDNPEKVVNREPCRLSGGNSLSGVVARELSGLMGTEEVPHDQDTSAAGDSADEIQASPTRMAGTTADAGGGGAAPGGCERTFRRYVERYEEAGLDGLVDKRPSQVSARAVDDGGGTNIRCGAGSYPPRSGSGETVKWSVEGLPSTAPRSRRSSAFSPSCGDLPNRRSPERD